MTAFHSTIRLRPVNLAEAQAVAARCAHLPYSQDPGYALEAAARVGAHAEFHVLEDGGPDAAGLAVLRVKRLPLIGGGLAYLHGGPALTRTSGVEDDWDRWETCLRAVAAECSRRRLTLRVSSPLLGDDDARLAARYRRCGFRPGEPGAATIVLDLAPSLDILRAGFAGKWRTDLRRGEASGLQIVASAEPGDIARMQPLLETLAERKGFAVPQDAHFFARAAAHAARKRAPPFVVHLAFHGDQLVAGHIGAYTGDTAVYLLGAATQEGRDTRAAFLLQWAAIAAAHARGLARYDLGGSTGPPIRKSTASSRAWAAPRSRGRANGPGPTACWARWRFGWARPFARAEAGDGRGASSLQDRTLALKARPGCRLVRRARRQQGLRRCSSRFSVTPACKSAPGVRN